MRGRITLVLVLVALVGLVARSAQAGSPVLLVSFDGGNGQNWCQEHKGKCAGDEGDPLHLRVNYEGLEQRGGIAQIADMLRADGHTVDAHYFSSSWALHDTPASSQPVPGFLEAAKLVQATPADTHIVVIGASQGGYWSHLLTMALPQIPIAVLVDMDTICLGWQGFQKLFAELPQDQQTPLEALVGDWLAEQHICGNTVNEVPWNVETNLEVRTGYWLRGAPLIQEPYEALTTDMIPNRRAIPGFSQVGIERYVERWNTHGNLLAPHEPSTIWVGQMLRRLLHDPS
jgi:hypothetical protein